MKILTSTFISLITTLVLAQLSSTDGAPHCTYVMYYSPVCGTNNETYINSGQLACAKIKIEDLDKWYDGECIAGYADDDGTYSTNRKTIGRNRWWNKDENRWVDSGSNIWDNSRERFDNSFEMKLGFGGHGHGKGSQIATALLLAKAMDKSHKGNKHGFNNKGMLPVAVPQIPQGHGLFNSKPFSQPVNPYAPNFNSQHNPSAAYLPQYNQPAYPRPSAYNPAFQPSAPAPKPAITKPVSDYSSSNSQKSTSRSKSRGGGKSGSRGGGRKG